MGEIKLPTDPFDQMLERLTGLPDGAHTSPSVIQATDFYGNTTSYMVQTVRWEEGETVFVTQVNATGAARYILPPKVTATIVRQRDAVSLKIKRRIGKRIAAERKEAGLAPTFTPAMRAKALATRKRNAAARVAK